MRVVAVTAIPGIVRRGSVRRRSLQYSQYCIATWKWWCSNNRIEFVELNKPLGGSQCKHLPPTIQRWLAPKVLIDIYGTDTEIAIIDANTMIRWDCPNLFDITAGRFCAVQDSYAPWIHSSIQAHKELFKTTVLNWWEYFNCGVVFLNASHVEVVADVVAFAVKHWPRLRRIQAAFDVGTDQTLLNFIVRQRGVQVTFLPPIYNLLHCVPMNAQMSAIEEQCQLERILSDASRCSLRSPAH
jgi:hypothetical protein